MVESAYKTTSKSNGYDDKERVEALISLLGEKTRDTCPSLS